MRKNILLSTFIAVLFLNGCNNDKKSDSDLSTLPDWQLPSTQLPIGEKDLYENRQKIDLVQGVEQYRIIRGYASLQDGFEAEIGFAKDEQEFLKFEAAIQKLGYSAKKVIPPNNSQAGKKYGLLGTCRLKIFFSKPS